MTSRYLTFDYFSRSLLDPKFAVYEILDNENHPENKNLKIDFDSIDKKELEKYVQENHIDFFIGRNENKDAERRLFYFVHQLNKDIVSMRIEKLLDSCQRPSPYNSNNLQSIIIDKNNLTSIEVFNINNFGFEKDNWVYTLCPILEQSNSSYWIFLTILKFAKENKLNFKIRLDPFIEISIKDYNPMFYKMLVHGKQLDWQRLKNLRNDDFGQWFNEKEYNRIGFTDYVWSPKDNEVHFTCEELPKQDYKGLKISRYFHAIFQKSTGGIIHCDGAIRIYSDSELNNRLKFHVKSPEVRKVGKRVKIFQYENNENNGKEIDHDVFCQLATNYFVWNDDVQKYFN